MRENEKKYLSAKQYLGQLQVLNTKANQKMEELAALKADAVSLQGINYNKERVQTTGVGDTIGNAVIKYVELDEEINREMDGFYQARHLIINQIQGLNVNDYMNILFKKYVQFKELVIIADEMQRSYPYTLELHKKALKMFEETYQGLVYLT